jgi:hypothetical protein
MSNNSKGTDETIETVGVDKVIEFKVGDRFFQLELELRDDELHINVHNVVNGRLIRPRGYVLGDNALIFTK